MTTPDTAAGLKPLRESNALLGDPAGLKESFERDGYLFFRDVLDKDAVGKVRAVYLDVLGEMGVVEKGAPVPRWNGADIANFPFKIAKLETAGAWEEFVAHPRIHAFFRQVLGEDPYWLPQTEHRVTEPVPRDGRDRFMYRHQDGFSNRGVGFHVCWVPLVDIDRDTGGLAVAEGWNRRGLLQDSSGARQPNGNPLGITEGTIPLSDWRLSDYHPGDVILFSITTPHSGIYNHSDLFRLSMDLRVLPASAPRPVVGTFVSADAQTVTVRDEAGAEHRFAFDAKSFARLHGGVEITVAEVPVKMRPGDPVYVSHENGAVRMLRPRRGARSN